MPVAHWSPSAVDAATLLRNSSVAAAGVSRLVDQAGTDPIDPRLCPPIGLGVEPGVGLVDQGDGLGGEPAKCSQYRRVHGGDTEAANGCRATEHDCLLDVVDCLGCRAADQLRHPSRPSAWAVVSRRQEPHRRRPGLG